MTLTETTQNFKTTVKIIGVAFALFVLFRISQDTIRAIFPKKEEELIPTPTVQYGKMPKLKLPSIVLAPEPKPSFALDLVEANLPVEPTLAKVYPVLRAPYGFLALDRAKEIAKRLNFTAEPQAQTSTEYIWTAPNRKLSMDVESLNFTYEYAYLTDPSVFINNAFTSKASVEEKTMEVLKENGLIGGSGIYGGTRGVDFEQGEKVIQFLRYQNGRLRTSRSLAETQAARADFFRQKIDGLSILPPNPDQGLINVLISGVADDERTNQFTEILEINYNAWVISYEQGATYPLRTSISAWEELQADLSYLTHLELETTDTTELLFVQSFISKEVYLGYLDLPEYQRFLQPVWVFSGIARTNAGSANWTAFVPAVDTTWVEE